MTEIGKKTCPLGEDCDLTVARGRRLDTLRTETGRTDFGEVGV